MQHPLSFHRGLCFGIQSTDQRMFSTSRDWLTWRCSERSSRILLSSWLHLRRMQGRQVLIWLHSPQGWCHRGNHCAQGCLWECPSQPWEQLLTTFWLSQSIRVRDFQTLLPLFQAWEWRVGCFWCCWILEGSQPFSWCTRRCQGSLRGPEESSGGCCVTGQS